MLHLHSTIAIVLLLALVISIVITLSNYLGNKPYNRKIALLGFIASHIQLLVGLILFFYLKYPSMISGAVMKDPTLRFIIIEQLVTLKLKRLKMQKKQTKRLLFSISSV